MKKWNLLALFSLLPVLVFSAGGKETASDGGYLRLAWWGNTVRDERTIKVVEMFKAQNPGIVIDTEITGWGSYWDKLNTQASTNNLPDIIQQDYAYIQQWVSRNQLMDLTPYVQKGTFDASRIQPDVLAGGNINGKLYGISLGLTAPGHVYDPAVVAKAGLPPIDSSKWTLADFERIALAIYQKTGVKTLPFCPSEPKSGFEPFARQNGSSFFADDGKSVGFTNDPQDLRDFWSVQVRLLEADALLSPDEAFVRTTMEEDPFSKGLTWNQFISSNQLIATANAAGRPVSMLLTPILPNSKRLGNFVKPTMYFSVSAKSANADLAVKFINYFVNDIEANNVLLAERGIPIPSHVSAHLASVNDPIQKEIFSFVDLVNRNSSPISPPDPPGSVEVVALFRDTTVQVLNKTVTIEEGIQKFIARANEILSVNK
jgi:multiple sugar transport system substrate-binding protein